MTMYGPRQGGPTLSSRSARSHSTVLRRPSSRSVVARHPRSRCVSSTSATGAISRGLSGSAPKRGATSVPTQLGEALHHRADRYAGTGTDVQDLPTASGARAASRCAPTTSST